MIPYEEYRYVLYAREFGWTPAQVDEIPLTTEPWLLPIQKALNEYEAEMEKKAIEKAKAEAKSGRR